MSSNHRRFLMILGLALGLAACSSGRRDELRFSHAFHKQNEAACADCHGDLGAASDLKADHFPGHDQCSQCHDQVADREQCKYCHSDADHAVKLPRHWTPPGLQFSHALHVAKVEAGCEACHQDVIASESSRAPEARRTHQLCMKCHRQDYRAVKCEQCHAEMQQWKDRPFQVFDHDADFLSRHGVMAQSDAQVCQHCHTDDQCAQCHSTLQTLKPDRRFRMDVKRELVHRGDYLTRHRLDANLDRMRCYKCHDNQECSSCHEKRGVSLAGGAHRHPSGWMQVGSSSFHGQEARHKIALCATCHDRGEKSSCLACHRPGGVGGSPHPGGEGEGDRSSKPCSTCHSH
jgi:hypothetical protein